MLFGKNYKIESDSMNVTILKRMVADGKRANTKQAGREYWTPIAYYGNVKKALKGLVDLEVAETNLVDLKTVVAKIDELKELIDHLPDNLK
jgi:hypothetical protein